ncbi:MAG TPA: CoA transferase [Acidimicrobiales bacterium]|nr:CoA transferase [Acidimicrobiales bacterium]
MTGSAWPAVDVFDGVRVVELAQFVFVPAAGALLADWGADVVKIEHPVRGDGYRALVSQGILRTSATGVNENMEMHNRGKRSIGLDVASPKGRRVLLELVASADVFLTNFLPSTLARWGLDVEGLRAVNPRLIYARGHGHGVRGPDADMPAYDATAFWARGGLGATLTPPALERPVGQRGGFGDRTGATNLAFGIASALFRRERTGAPSVVDVSLLSTAMWTLASDVLSGLQGNWAAAPVAGQAARLSPNPLSNTYETKDGRFLSLLLLQPDRHWPALARAIGREDLLEDPAFATGSAILEHPADMVDILEPLFKSRTLAEWRDAFLGARFPWAPYAQVPEVIEDPQVAANGYVAEVEHEAGNFRVPTGAVQFDERPAALRRGPEHAEHTEEILLELGYGWEEIATFKEEGVVT